METSACVDTGGGLDTIQVQRTGRWWMGHRTGADMAYNDGMKRAPVHVADKRYTT